MSDGSTTHIATSSKAQEVYLSWVTDVLVYIVVLNLFVEFVDTVVIDSFVISILTAVLLRGLVGVVIRMEDAVHSFFSRWEGKAATVLGVTAMWVVLFGSKFVILEVVNFVFGDHVELGHFIEILSLIVSMMLARRLMGWIYVRLGTVGADPVEPTEP